eukprot:g31220.t1
MQFRHRSGHGMTEWEVKDCVFPKRFSHLASTCVPVTVDSVTNFSFVSNLGLTPPFPARWHNVIIDEGKNS